MEILNNIWTALTTENEKLIGIFSLPLCFVEIYIFMLIFTRFLNIQTTKKNRLLYTICASVLSILGNLLIPNPVIQLIFNLFVAILFTKIVFKVNFFIAALAQCAPYLLMTLLDYIFSNLCFIFFKIDFYNYILIPICRIPYAFVIYGTLLLIYFLMNKFYININVLNDMTTKNRIIITVNSILGLVIITAQSYLTIFYGINLPFIIGFISILSLIIYFFISIFSLTRMTKLALTTTQLENVEEYNKTLVILHDNVRVFKHDFDNIVSTIGGYITTNDMKGLSKYYDDLVEDCQRVNNLYTLNPNVINNPRCIQFTN